MTSRDLVERTVDVAAEIEQIARQQQAYKEGTRLPVLASSPEELRSELEDILTGVSYDSQVAKAASLIATALEEDVDAKQLPYLGQALVLTAESQKGRSHEIAFQETVRYLLAMNDYEPVRTKTFESGTYHFFTDEAGTKVVAVSKAGCDLYTAELKSKYHLDELVNDFDNLRQGTSVRLKKYDDKVNAITSFPYCTLTAVTIISTPVGIIPYWLLGDISGVTAIGLIAGGSIGSYALYRIGQKVEHFLVQRKRSQEKPNFPYTAFTVGVSALIDAFPLEENKVLHENPVLTLLPEPAGEE